jgi:hypothetical protein
MDYHARRDFKRYGPPKGVVALSEVGRCDKKTDITTTNGNPRYSHRRAAHQMSGNNRIWARRLALQIATQLPDCEGDALEVLRYARELVSYVSGEDKKPSPKLTLVQTVED